MMKILQLMAGAERGGAETAFVDTCIAFHEAGQSIEVATRSNDLRVPALRKAGLRVHTLPFGGALDFYTPWRLRKIIKAFKPDIVQSWMSRASAHAPAWRPAMNVPRYLVVPRLGGYYKIRYFKSADYFTTITPDIKRHLVDHGVAADRIRHVNNFAETESAPRPLARGKFGTPEAAPLVLGLGRLHEAKAFDVLIKAVSALPGVYLWIAGEGPERPALERLIRDLSLEERIRLLGWRSDRAALFQAADLCVFSSRYEPFGTVFVQAWAQETPLVTTDADGPRQFVRDGEDGLIVPVDDAEAMAAAIRRVLEDKLLTAKLVENGYARYRAEFTKEKTVWNYLDFFRDIRTREGL